MSKRLTAMLAGAVALAVLVGGCGDSSDSDSGESLTKAEFVKQADAICSEGTREISAAYKAFAKENGIKGRQLPEGEQGYEVAEDIYVPTVEKRLEALQELNPPAADEKKVEAILIATEDGLAEVDEDITTLFTLKDNPFNEARELSGKYGLKVCAKV